MLKFVLICALATVACAAPADKPTQQSLEPAETAWNAAWNNPAVNPNVNPHGWNHPNAWAGAQPWNNRGWNNRYDTASRWGGADPWNRVGGAAAGNYNYWGGRGAAGTHGWQAGVNPQTRWGQW